MDFLYIADLYIELYTKYRKYHGNHDHIIHDSILKNLYYLYNSLEHSNKDTELKQAVWNMIKSFYPYSALQYYEHSSKTSIQ